MKITFNDDEMQRILKEFATVNFNKKKKCKTLKSAIKIENKNIELYAAVIDNWIRVKIKTICLSELKPQHDSDCATYNMPAMPNKPCNCRLSKK